MISISVFVIVVIIVIGLWVWKFIDEYHNWDIMFAATGDKKSEIMNRYHFLKRKGVKCRIKQMRTDVYREFGGQKNHMTTFQIKVRKEDLPSAEKYMAAFKG